MYKEILKSKKLSEWSRRISSLKFLIKSWTINDQGYRIIIYWASLTIKCESDLANKILKLIDLLSECWSNSFLCYSSEVSWKFAGLWSNFHLLSEVWLWAAIFPLGSTEAAQVFSFPNEKETITPLSSIIDLFFQTTRKLWEPTQTERVSWQQLGVISQIISILSRPSASRRFDIFPVYLPIF